MQLYWESEAKRLEKKLRILVVHNYYQIPGGEDTVVQNECSLLEQHGHEVVRYTRSNNELKKRSLFGRVFLPLIAIFNLRTYFEVYRIIRQNKIDVVHVHNTLWLISPSVYYAAFACRVPVLQTIHNFRLLCPAATFYRNGAICEECVAGGMLRAVKYRCYRHSRAQTLSCVLCNKTHRMLRTYGKLNYLCLTEFNKKKLLNLKQIDPCKVFVKPNSAQAPQQMIPYQQRDNLFVYMGRLDRIKGVDILLQAWKIMGKNAAKLVICGMGPMEAWCREFVANNDLSNIEIRGFVDNTEAKALIGQAKGLVMPTQWYEGFPMVIAEAFSAGTPVIGSMLGNVGSIVKDGENGYTFPCDSPEALAHAIQQCQTEFKAFPIQDTRKYSPEVNYRLLCSIYHAILHQKEALEGGDR